MAEQNSTTEKKQREWHFVLPDFCMIRRGKAFSIGIHVIETGLGLTAVAELRSKDAVTGENPDTLIFSTVSAAAKYLNRLGGPNDES